MKLAVLMSFSGEGGVEKMMMNLIREMASYADITIDFLLIKASSLHLNDMPSNVNVIQLKANHTLTSVLDVKRYLQAVKPQAMLVAKDRAGRAALLARRLAGVDTRIVIRLGTNLSTALQYKNAFNQWLRLAPMRALYPKVDKVVAVSEGVKADTVITTRLPCERIVVIRNPVITEKMLAQSQQDSPHPWLDDALDDSGVPVIMGLGRLSKQKDFHALIKAFAIVRKQQHARLVILGEGKDRESLEQLTQDLGVEDDVLMPGFDANPYRWLSRVQLFVLSSRWEGSPNALTEALALGVPCVSTRCPSGPDELLDNGRFGPLVPVEDYQAMANAMQATLQNPLSADVLKSAVQEYRPAVSAAAYLHELGFADKGEQ